MKFKDLTESSHKCPHCGGPLFSEMMMMEKKDACYYKVKASAKVWPSAYASGRLVQCRKKGAANYGNKSKNEDVNEMNRNQQPVTAHQVYLYMLKQAPDFMKHAPTEDVKRAILKALSFGSQISVEDLASYAYGMLKSNSLDEDKKVSSHSELAKLAREAHIEAVRQGNAQMANHYKQAYEKHKRLAASERKSAAKGMAEDASPNFVWIQGDFDGDTAVSGPEQGSWKDQTTRQIELIRGRLSNVERLDGPPPQAGKTIKQARIPLTLDAGGGRQFSTTGVDLELTVAPNGYITKGDYGRVRGTAVVKIMRPGANESMEQSGGEPDIQPGMKVSQGTVVKVQGNTVTVKASNGELMTMNIHDVGQSMAEHYNPEYDDEAGMADNNLETLQRAVEGIDDLIQSGDNLPEWCQEKIAVAKSMLVAVWDYMYSEEASDEVDPEVDAMFEAVDRLAHAMARRNGVDVELVWESFEALPDHVLWETAQYQLRQLNEDWQKVNKQDKTDGMSRKAVKAYRRENPGSKLKTAVTTKPSKLKKGGKAAKRRKSFCARMRGMKKSRASAKTKRNPNSPINKALRRWNC